MWIGQSSSLVQTRGLKTALVYRLNPNEIKACERSALSFDVDCVTCLELLVSFCLSVDVTHVTCDVLEGDRWSTCIL